MLRLYNTLTRQKDIFEPYNPPLVGMYVCGVTVYDHCHIGHARSFVVFDVIRRYLQTKGYMVSFVYNITDIDDKIIDKASSLGVSYKKVSELYTESLFSDLKKMDIIQASFYPKATENIGVIKELILKLIKNGFAYEKEGNVYFSVKKFNEYGKLSGRKLSFNVNREHKEEKVDIEDFALWKRSKEGEPYWESPWGRGRPGWHIECSAMSMKYLGESFDIHGGGNDLIFPHHENEIAQSESASGKPFAKYWLHNGMVIINSEKMSKSACNFFYLKDLLQKYKADVIKLYILFSHYRSPLEFNEDLLLQANEAYKKIREVFYKVTEEFSPGEMEEYFYSEEIDCLHSSCETQGRKRYYQDIINIEKEFFNAMDDDFNTAIAIGSIFKLISIINTNLACKNCSNVNESRNNRKVAFLAFQKLRNLSAILGLFSGLIDEVKQERTSRENIFLQVLINLRNICREEKKWNLADLIRDELNRVGVELRDTPEGTKAVRKFN